MSILITGASGYLGGSLLAQLHDALLPGNRTIYALVRSQEQAEAVGKYGAQPFTVDFQNEQSVTKSIVDAQIFVIYFLVDAATADMLIPLIKALAEVKKRAGREVHFLHTSGAKIFSEHAGMPTDRRLLDTDPGLYGLQKSSNAPHQLLTQVSFETASGYNVQISIAFIHTTLGKKREQHRHRIVERYGVCSYIFIPCVVYGEGKGFGNKTSIQTVAVVKAAKGTGAMNDVNPEGWTWPSPEYGKNGYYLASSGSVAWYDVYAAMVKALAKRGVIDSADVERADHTALDKMAQALGCPTEMVAVQLGGKCTLEAKRAYQVGWRPDYEAGNIIKAADAEVEFILKHL